MSWALALGSVAIVGCGTSGTGASHVDLPAAVERGARVMPSPALRAVADAGPSGLLVLTEGVVVRVERDDAELRLVVAPRPDGDERSSDILLSVPWWGKRPVDVGEGSDVTVTHHIAVDPRGTATRHSVVVRELDGDLLVAVVEGVEAAAAMGLGAVPAVDAGVVYTTVSRNERACRRVVEHHRVNLPAPGQPQPLRPGEVVLLDGNFWGLLDAAVSSPDDACEAVRADRLAWVVVRAPVADSPRVSD